jgi:hypothetical protein
MFVTPDNIIPNQYDPQYLNRYAYCRNNPLIYTDPSGHKIDGPFDKYNEKDWKGFFAEKDSDELSKKIEEATRWVEQTRFGPPPPVTEATIYAGKKLTVPAVKCIAHKAGRTNITFINDQPKNPTPDQSVLQRTAEDFEDIIGQTGFDSININSTTGGVHTGRGHMDGLATDSNNINGIPVGNPNGIDDVAKLQEIASKQKDIKLNLGPVRCEYTTKSGVTSAITDPKTIAAHPTHVHIEFW